MQFLITVIAFVITALILIAVHEFGHFWIARRCGVKVERFSLGFGKPLWRKVDRQGTEFVLASIPFGGYVKMLDGQNTTLPEASRSEAFNTQPIAKRMAIIAAGPLANILLALILYWLINVIGQPMMRPIIHGVIPGSVAEQATLEKESIITAINGKKVHTWLEVTKILKDFPMGQIATLSVNHLDNSIIEDKQLMIPIWQDKDRRDLLDTIGIIPALGQVTLTVYSIIPNSAAANAGLQENDKLLALADEPITYPNTLIDQIKKHPNQRIDLLIERHGERQTVPLVIGEQTTSEGKIEGIAGFTVSSQIVSIPDNYLTIYRLNMIDSCYYAIKQVWQVSERIIHELISFIIGKAQTDVVAGPITFAKVAGQTVQQGLNAYLKFLAIVSLNLGIINLFPLPILDGGQLLFLVVEKIIGRPISTRVQHYGYRISIIILIMLMGLAFFNDFTQW